MKSFREIPHIVWPNTRDLIQGMVTWATVRQKIGARLTLRGWNGPNHLHAQDYQTLAAGSAGSVADPVALGAYAMRCKSCGSEKLRNFNGEIAIHFPGLKNVDEPIVWVFSQLVACLNCGTAEFAIPEDQLRLLARGHATGGG